MQLLVARNKRRSSARLNPDCHWGVAFPVVLTKFSYKMAGTPNFCTQKVHFKWTLFLGDKQKITATVAGLEIKKNVWSQICD